jgi:hypothetical protein
MRESGYASHNTGMDRQYIRDHNVIERYMAHSLTAEEEQEFEESYLGNSEILDELQAAERLREGVKDLEGAGRLERMRPPGWWQSVASPRYAAAASVLLAVSLVFSAAMYRENRSLREAGTSPASAMTRVVNLESVRGGDTTTIREPEDDELALLVLDTGPTEYGTYRATLTRQLGGQSEVIWRRTDLTPELEGRILMSVSGRLLRPGIYVAALDGHMNEWPAERFEVISRTSLTVVARD